MKILVVDDEILARQRICRLINELKGFEVVGEAGDGKSAVKKVNQLEPDIVILDIRMPAQDGLSAAKEIAKLETPPAIIFATAYDEYAVASYDVAAVDYLLKPVTREKLKTALSRAVTANRALLQHLQAQNKKREYIKARVGKNIELIPIEDIVYFSASEKYTCIKYSGGEVLVEESLKELEQELSDKFVRVHRNALVAISEISGLLSVNNKTMVKIKNSDTVLEVSRRMLAQVRKALAYLTKPNT